MDGGGPYFERIVVLAGLTGLRLDSIVEFVRREVVPSLGDGSRIYVSKFEDSLSMEYGGAPIERIAALMLSSSRSKTLEKLTLAFDSIVRDARLAGAERLVVSMHLSYFSQNIIIPNPAVGYAVENSREAVIIYFVEDYYDAVRRVRDKRAREEDPDVARHRLYLDPITYLSWRGVEHNILTMLRSFYRDRLKTFMIGVKHPRATLKKLLVEAIGGERRLHVYYSHPISIFRVFRGLSRGLRLEEVPGVSMIELIKEQLRGIDEVVLYEPTSVDELITTSKMEACKAARGILNTGSPAPNGGGDQVISPLIGPGDRWPVPGDSIHSDYPYTRGSPVNIIGEDMVILYPEFARELAANYCSRLSYLTQRLGSLIVSQIEMRDYSYIEQSKATIVVAPLFYRLNARGSPGNGRCEVVLDMWLYIAQGVEAEIRRAHSLASRVIMLIAPQPLKRLEDAVCRGDQGCMERAMRSLESESVRLDPRVARVNCECISQVELLGIGSPIEVSDSCRDSSRVLRQTFQETLYSLIDSERGSRPLSIVRASDTAILALTLDGLKDKIRRALGLEKTESRVNQAKNTGK